MQMCRVVPPAKRGNTVHELINFSIKRVNKNSIECLNGNNHETQVVWK